jgi:hypothetical protein
MMHPMRRYEERCGECSPRGPCRNHIEVRTHRDAAIAADIGVGWARFVHREVDIRKPWPPYGGRCAAIALRLVGWLTQTEERRDQLARICCWRAGISWDPLLERARDLPYREPDREGRVYQLQLPGGVQPVWIQFRPRRRAGERKGSLVELTDAALAQLRQRAGRYRFAQGLHADDDHDRSLLAVSDISRLRR